jgi:hypothetical protein
VRRPGCAAQPANSVPSYSSVSRTVATRERLNQRLARSSQFP